MNQSEPKIDPLKTYRLRHQGFIDPRWFNRAIQGEQVVTVQEGGRSVELLGMRLEIVYEPGDPPLAEGTLLRVGLNRNFYAYTQADWERREAQIKAREAFEEAKWREQLSRIRAEAEAFNARLRLPVKWTVGIKDVLSGLTEHSSGNGRNRATVEHILLLEDLDAGRIKRQADSFLCTSRSGSDGKRWSGSEKEYWVDGEGNRFAPKVSCKKCLEIARRWTREDDNTFTP